MNQEKFNKIYQFKFSVKNIKPLIWRRVQVPEFYTFWDLHVAIQDSLEWFDYHLHEFEMKHPKTNKKHIIGMTYIDDFLDFDSDRNLLTDTQEKITDWFTEENNKANYSYDFGDGWEVSILLEKILPKDDKQVYPFCVKGKRAGPPEDCGGPWGYEDLVEIMENPRHPEYKEKKEWLGGKLYPEDFDPAEVEFDDPEARYMIAYINMPN